MLDSALVGAAQERIPNPSLLYVPAHATILKAIYVLHSRGEPTEAWSVATYLQQTKELDSVGGIPFITQVSKSSTTSIQFHQALRTVASHITLRALIRGHTSAVENCYNYTGTTDEELDRFIAESVVAVPSVAHDLSSRQFNPESLSARPSPRFSVAGIPISTPGNLTAIYAVSKAGKSAFIAAAICATFTTPDSGIDCLGLQGPNYTKGAVLHFDTEQSRYDYEQKVVLSAQRRASLQALPDWFLSYHMTGESSQSILRHILSSIRKAHARFGSVHSVLIDGVADLVRSPNDEEESYEVIRLLHEAAIKYDCSIICVLHLNPTSKDRAEKGRGHLGSQLERKAESNLTLKKEGDISVLLAEGRQRNAPIPPDKSPAFQWSDSAGMHVSCKPPTSIAPARRGRPEKYPFSHFKSVIPPKSSPGVPLQQLAKACSVNMPIDGKRLYNVVQRWEEEGCIEVIDTPQGRLYRAAV